MFDFNAKLGHWPYRPVRGLHDLLREMDALGIEQAAVSSLSAVHYLNPHDGNRELVSLIASHRDRLIPFAVLRPGFSGVLDDFRACCDEFGMRAVVLYSNYHEFDLATPELEPLMAAAQERGLPVCVQAGLEDPRRQFRPCRVAEVPAAAIGDFARRWPAVAIIALGLKFRQPEQAGIPLPANFHFDTSNYETLGDLEQALQSIPLDRILLGTNYPLFTSRANIEKLRQADIPEKAREAIAEGNARRLFGFNADRCRRDL